jgi:hypothetical protein
VTGYTGAVHFTSSDGTAMMGCQKKIAREIVAAGGDYVLAVKENRLLGS